jgi:UDP-3-O-[3-hydroxymyristoyl] glucosamine N-acyltransferase
MRVVELAEWLGLTFEGDGEREIRSVAPIENAGADQIAFVGSAKAARAARTCAAGCLIVSADFENREGRTLLRAKQPRRAAARIIARLHPPRARRPGIHPTAVIGERTVLAPGVAIGAYAVIGEECHIGAGCTIGAHCALGDNVTLGADCLLHARVTIYDDVEIGSRAILHSGAVLGADGFGFVLEDDHYEKFPQIGRVVIGNDVEIGAGSAVDRAALGVTSIGDGVKLDNMVHIAHNCSIGRHVVIAAQTGIAGGTVVEEYAVLGGQVGIGDNATVKARAILGSKSGVLTSKILKGDGEQYWGIPAKPVRQCLEEMAHIARLPELRGRVDRMEQRLARLERVREE